MVNVLFIMQPTQWDFIKPLYSWCYLGTIGQLVLNPVASNAIPKVHYLCGRWPLKLESILSTYLFVLGQQMNHSKVEIHNMAEDRSYSKGHSLSTCLLLAKVDVVGLESYRLLRGWGWQGGGGYVVVTRSSKRHLWPFSHFIWLAWEHIIWKLCEIDVVKIP